MPASSDECREAFEREYKIAPGDRNLPSVKAAFEHFERGWNHRPAPQSEVDEVLDIIRRNAKWPADYLPEARVIGLVWLERFLSERPYLTPSRDEMERGE
ncbi:MAG: hypothetical protein EBZ49_14740 [Proteobacteria bacterium]|nr:hypothetical protein [Pseudomonadota bacterium]